MDIATHEVAWYVIKQKMMTKRNSCTTQPKQIFTVLRFYKNIRPLRGNLCTIIRRPPIFKMMNQEKIFVLYSSKYGITCLFWKKE
jgi:hypothetical protein